MAWLVKIAARAQRDLAQLFEDMDAIEEGAAQKWYRGLRDAVLSLEEMPQRCPVVRQKSKIRQLVYGHKPHVYLVLYRIREKQREVDVLHIPAWRAQAILGNETGAGQGRGAARQKMKR